MTNDLIKYEPVTVLETYEGDLYFAHSSLKEVMRAMSDKFIEVEGEILATSSIKKVFRDEHGVTSLSKEQRKDLRQRKNQYAKTFKRDPSDVAIKAMIGRIMAHDDSLAPEEQPVIKNGVLTSRAEL